MDRKELKEKVKELPANLSIASLALLLGLTERSGVIIDEILRGPSRGMMKSYHRISGLKNFWDYYDELKDLKKTSARVILWQLKKKGLVKKSEKSYKLTLSGLKVVKNFQEKVRAIEPWDGKWRMIFFDIPEKRRADRDWLRFELASLNYKPIQKSVFLGKQAPEESFYQEIIERRLYQYIRSITIGEIDNDQILEQFQ